MPMPRSVTALTRPLTLAVLAALAVLALVVISPAQADRDASGPPSAASGPDWNITSTTATVSGWITPNGRHTTVRFDYGPTTAYGQSVQGTVAASEGSKYVVATLRNLTPGTLYHWRIAATNDRGSAAGEDRAFTTKGTAPAPAPTTTTPTTTAPSATPAATPEPQLGQSMVVAPVEGTVTVREPGTNTFVPLKAGDAVPVGTVVDTRNGAIALTSAAKGDTTQTAQFGDGMFEVRQSKKGGGLTDIVLRGGNFAACGSSRRARAATVQSRRKPKRRLWARDNGGKFRTHGRNSVATVRGTRWVTTDTCAGTRTTVTEGSVAVRDLRRKKTVVVRKGKSYLARGRR